MPRNAEATNRRQPAPKTDGPDGPAEGSAQPGNGPSFPESAKSQKIQEWGPQAGAGKNGPNG